MIRKRLNLRVAAVVPPVPLPVVGTIQQTFWKTRPHARQAQEHAHGRPLLYASPKTETAAAQTKESIGNTQIKESFGKNQCFGTQAQTLILTADAPILFPVFLLLFYHHFPFSVLTLLLFRRQDRARCKRQKAHGLKGEIPFEANFYTRLPNSK